MKQPLIDHQRTKQRLHLKRFKFLLIRTTVHIEINILLAEFILKFINTLL